MRGRLLVLSVLLFSLKCKQESPISSVQTNTAAKSAASEQQAPENRALRSAAVPGDVVLTRGYILFTGIVTLEHGTNDPVKRVVLPRVTPGRARACPNDADCEIPDHVAFIAVDTAKFKVETSLTGWTKGNNTVYFLSGSVPIEVADLQGPAVPPTDVVEAGTSGHHTKGNLYYVPHLKDINKKECKPAQIQFNARVTTPAGAFQSYVLRNVIQDFADPSVSMTPVHSQCVAEIAEWAFTVLPAADGTPEVRLMTGGQQLMRVTHAAADDLDPIAVVIGNAHRKDVEDAVSQMHKSMKRDPHFDIYYDRCDRMDLTAFPIPRDGSLACEVDTPGAYFPDWMQYKQAIPAAAPGGGKALTHGFKRFLVGGFDCGPDQVP